MLPNAIGFFDSKFNVTSSFADHLKRVPPSSEPGNDHGTGIGTHIWQPWYLKNLTYCQWDNIGGWIVMITYPDMIVTHEGKIYKGVRYQFHHCKENIPSGKMIPAKTPFALTGNSGAPKGPHCHITTYINAQCDSTGKPIGAKVNGPRPGLLVDSIYYTNNPDLMSMYGILKPTPEPTTLEVKDKRIKELESGLTQVQDILNRLLPLK